MDDRQAQIRERAGLEESRLNQEFIDWLGVWGPRLLTMAVLVMGAYAGYRYIEKTKRAKIDLAFSDFENARGRGNASPEALLAVADDFQGVKSVSTLARLEAADAYLDSVRRGIKPGAQLKNDETNRPTGELVNPEDALAPQDRENYLGRAEALYTEVYGASTKDEAQVLMKVNAMFGLAAVAECREQLDKAREWYDAIAKQTEGTSWDLHGKLAKSRSASLDGLKSFEPLPASAQVPKPPKPEPVVLPPVTPPATETAPAPKPEPGAEPATPPPAPAPAEVPSAPK